MWHELLDGLVKVFLAALAVSVPLLGSFGHVWIRDWRERRHYKRLKDQRMAEEAERIIARVELKHVNGAAKHHAEDDEEVGGDPPDDPPDGHIHRRRIRRP